MNKEVRSLLISAVLTVFAAGATLGAVVTLPDTSASTTLTATVSEQCDITVPATVTWTVDDVATATASAGQTVSAANIVLASATKQLKISIQAGAAAFTPPVALATTWSAGDVTWDAPVWTNGTGATGTLSNAAYSEVVTAAADAASVSTAALVFTLAAKNTVKRSGNHTLAVTWKVESIGA